MHPAYIQDDVETNLKLNFVFFLDNFQVSKIFSGHSPAHYVPHCLVEPTQDFVKICAKF